MDAGDIEICAGRRVRRAISGRTSANIGQPRSWRCSPGGGLKSAQLQLGVSRSTSDKEEEHPMTTTNHRSHRVAFLTGALCLCMLTILAGCPDPASPSPCFSRSDEVVVPSADTTDPTVTLAFYLPNGDIVTVPPNPILSTVAITQSGTVQIFARASDDQGVRDVQLWVWTTTCSKDPSTEIAECKPENPQTPMASNRDASGPGQNGCTERVAPQSLNVSNNSRGSVSYQVEARGVNFGGKEVRTPRIDLKVQ